MVASLREQLAPMLLPAPVPEIFPADGRALRALLVGAPEQHSGESIPVGLRAYGITVDRHWKTDRAVMQASVPSGTELVLIVTSAVSHNLFHHAVKLAKKAGIPSIAMKHKQSSWGKDFARWGLTSPPAWGAKPILEVVPAPSVPCVTAVEPDSEESRLRKEFGLALKTARMAAGYHQGELAQKLGFQGGSVVSNWETGQNEPTWSNYIRLLELLPAMKSVPPSPKWRIRVDLELTPKAPEPEPAPVPQDVTPASFKVELPGAESLTIAKMTPLDDAGIRFARAVAEGYRLKKTIAELQKMLETNTAEVERLNLELLEQASGGEQLKQGEQ